MNNPKEFEFRTSSSPFHTFIPQLSMLFQINSLSLSPENN